MATQTMQHTALALGLLAAVGSALPAAGFEFTDAARWDRTATDGGGLGQGDPTTLTWSIVPDFQGGPPDSELINFFDTLFPGGSGSDLTLRPWFHILDDSFERFEALSGLTLTYDDDDDGVKPSSLFQRRGVLDVRGDIRVSAFGIDGQDGQNVIAQAFFPEYGDMMLDSDNTDLFGNTFNDSRAARNVIMHELGHALGISHIESSDGAFLMEPFLDVSFDGPQLDDILALHRGYGDQFEKTNAGAGNETAPLATPLGLLADGVVLGRGTDAADTLVGRLDTDFLSIDDNSDTDFFSFTIDGEAEVDLTLTPRGPAYETGPEGGTQTTFNTAFQSDLSLALYDTDGTTLLTQADAAPLGAVESIEGYAIEAAGTYFVRVTGAANVAQFYELNLEADYVEPVVGDLDDDGDVDADDLAIVAAGWGNAVAPGLLTAGDPTGDGQVGIEDMELVLANWTQPAAATVPEPASMVVCFGLLVLRRRRSA